MNGRKRRTSWEEFHIVYVDTPGEANFALFRYAFTQIPVEGPPLKLPPSIPLNSQGCQKQDKSHKLLQPRGA